jgi:hypothetical protein
MQFQFDPDKAKSNLKKHKVSFADVEGVFYDPLAIHQEDPYLNKKIDGSLLEWELPIRFLSLFIHFVMT